MDLDTQAAAAELTPEERAEARAYLADTRDGVVQAVERVSQAQWHFKPSPDRWCIAELVEHLAIVENRVLQILRQIQHGPATPPHRNRERMHSHILQTIGDRSTKFQALPRIAPTGRWTRARALEEFVHSAASLAASLDSSDLRRSLYPHPVYGPLDGYEWILFTAGHNDRHLKQIDEVKVHPTFPPA